MASACFCVCQIKWIVSHLWIWAFPTFAFWNTVLSQGLENIINAPQIIQCNVHDSYKALLQNRVWSQALNLITLYTGNDRYFLCHSNTLASSRCRCWTILQDQKMMKLTHQEYLIFYEWIQCTRKNLLQQKCANIKFTMSGINMSVLGRWPWKFII